MTDADLRSRLATLRSPAPTEPAAARALFRAQIAQAVAPQAANAAPADASFTSARRFAPGPALLAPLLAVLLLLPLFRAGPATPAPPPVARLDLALLDELEQLFPGQLDAVVERDGALQLELAARPASSTPPNDQAVLLELTRGERRLRVLAYSGRPVRLRLEHDELHFSPLLTGSGQVMLTGDDFAWSPAAGAPPRALAGWRIHAQALADAVL